MGEQNLNFLIHCSDAYFHCYMMDTLSDPLRADPVLVRVPIAEQGLPNG